MNQPKEKLKYGHARGFVAGAVAACGAVTFTNPWEVVKTRLQLQGELQAHATNKQYGNALSAFAKIFRVEGITGLQRGLFPAYVYQIFLNGFRLGMYDPIRVNIQSGLDSFYGKGVIPSAVSMIFSGGIAGLIGAFSASPFNLVKTVYIDNHRECNRLPKEQG
jgi:solute carrier family 25, member 34/35